MSGYFNQYHKLQMDIHHRGPVRIIITIMLMIQSILVTKSKYKSTAIVVEPLQDPNEMQPAGSIKYKSKKFLFVPL